MNSQMERLPPLVLGNSIDLTTDEKSSGGADHSELLSSSVSSYDPW